MTLKTTLHPSEVAIATLLGKERYRVNREAGVKDNTTKVDPEHVHVNGALGELCASKILNLSMDLSTHPRSGGEDFKLHLGTTIDVKTITTPTHRLLVPRKGKHDCELYILVWWHDDTRTGTMFGYAHHDQIIQPDKIDETLDRPAYAMRSHELRSCDWMLP